MNDSKKNIRSKRQFHRVIFSREDGVISIFKPLSDTKKLNVTAASILNLSAGGLQFIVSKEDADGFQTGERLVFSGIKGIKDLEFSEDIEMEIMWVLELKFL